MKKILIYIISFFLFFAPNNFNVLASDYSNLYLIDQAAIFDTKTKEFIATNSLYLKENFNINYKLVTVASLNNTSIKKFTNNIFNELNLDNNSILIVVSKKERQIQIKVGESLSEFIPNNTINVYLKNYFLPYLQKERWNYGLKNGYSAFLKLIYENNNVETADIIVKNGNNFIYKYEEYITIVIFWIATILSYVLSAYFKTNMKKKKVRKLDTFIFSLCTFLNIVVLLIAYSIKNLLIPLIVIYELFIIFNNYKIPISKKRRKKHG